MDAPGTSTHYNHSKDSSRKRSDSVYRNGYHHPDSPTEDSRLSPISAYRYKKRKHRRSSRSRSKSSSPESRRKSRSSHYFSSSAYDKHGKTLSEYELENHALRTQLDMARKQIVGFELELHNCRNHASQAEHRLYAVQQENVATNEQKNEILNVMKTLKTAVESLQKERLDLLKANEESTKHSEANRAEVSSLKDQLANLTDRNNTLSRKCVNLLETSKTIKERMEAAETELLQLKPHTECTEKKLGEIEERLRSSCARISTFEARERMWSNEKRELDGRIKELQLERDSLKRQLNDIKSDEPAESNRNVRVELDGSDLEHLKAMHCVVESLHAHHRSEMHRAHSKLETVMARLKAAKLTKLAALENGVKEKK
ncbi:hypothetical protein DdX_03994 [Ditylenchus destructor]|uniref:Uncharacterized protein n=1 Tax=Ditylenchus destructor TaxID=166010 RepID=A0AAD4R5C5_9BILA|nr:hypothetical protein DdX_03994 [Ditylenchus destructor]